ncbi:MAG: homocysteine S-methyltransferase family protein [Rhodobacter sp.]|nr:homocysteine S-methyltransferase family protein [Rhodobacter sp.]
MSEITILDGGMGQELVRRHGAAPTPLWSTQVMIDRPELVRDLHRDFFAAGAAIATTNTYAVLRDRLTGVGLEDRFEDLMSTALDMAEAARAGFPGRLIAGAIGPLRASYRPDICPPASQAAQEYAPVVAALKSRADLLIIETMSSLDQADGALRAAVGQGVPVWLGVTVSDEDGSLLRSGEPLGDLAPLIERHAPDAVLLNCSRPESISVGLPLISGFGLPFGAYANGFTQISDGFKTDRPTVDALEHRKDLGPAEYADFAETWAGMGATLIGGCCEVGPDHIAELKRRFA